jgi:hypothetical protein
VWGLLLLSTTCTEDGGCGALKHEKTYSNDLITYQLVVCARKGMLVKGAALRMHHQAFSTHFKNVHSE